MDNKTNGNGPDMIVRWITIILFVVLSVLSFTTAVLARQTQDAVKKANIIAQCTTPGTQCYKLTQQAAQQRTKEVKAAAFCIVDTFSAFPVQELQSHRAELLAQYNTCVANASK